jgi:hypothetical protein
MAVVQILAMPNLGRRAGIVGDFQQRSSGGMACGNKHVPFVVDRSQRILWRAGNKRCRPQKPAGFGVERHDGPLRHADPLANTLVRDNGGRAIGRRESNLRIGPDRLAGLRIERHDATFGPTGHAEQLVVFHDHVFGQPPDAPLSVETFDQIDHPAHAPRNSIESGKPTLGIKQEHRAMAVRRCGA